MEIQNHYFKTPNEVFDEKGAFKSAAERLVYIYLCRCCNNDEGKAYPSYKGIAERCGISRRSALRAVKELIQRGYVVKKKRAAFNKEGFECRSWQSNVYEVKCVYEVLYGKNKPETETESVETKARGGVSLTPDNIENTGGGVTSAPGWCHSGTSGGVSGNHEKEIHEKEPLEKGKPVTNCSKNEKQKSKNVVKGKENIKAPELLEHYLKTYEHVNGEKHKTLTEKAWLKNLKDINRLYDKDGSYAVIDKKTLKTMIDLFLLKYGPHKMSFDNFKWSPTCDWTLPYFNFHKKELFNEAVKEFKSTGTAI